MVLGWFVNEVQRDTRLTGQFALLTPLVRGYLQGMAFAGPVDLLHTHPDGGPPSAADRAVTRRLVAAGAVIGLCLQAHLVVGPDEVWDCLRPDQDLTG